MADEMQAVPPSVPVDAGSDDTIATTVADAIRQAMARAHEQYVDTLGHGSTIGDLMPLPGQPVGGDEPGSVV